MGDRAYAQFDLPTSTTVSHRDTILAILAPDEEIEENGLTTFSLSEADAGGTREAEHLEQLGVPFVVRWEHGIQYVAGARCFIPGRESVEVETYGFGDGPAVLVRADGEPDPALLVNARRFLAMLKEFRALAWPAQATSRP